MAQYDYTHYLYIGKHEREVLIEYDVTPGQAATGPTYDSGGDPGYPPEVTVRKVTVQRLQPMPFGQPDVMSWVPAPDWLVEIITSSDEINNDLITNAEG